MKYRPEIDGLRAIAVIPVIIFHISPGFFPSGFIGVDIFFVISGYLITSLVLKEKNRKTFSFSNFWARRIKRLMPAMISVLLTTMFAGYFLLFPNQFKELGLQVVATIFMLANVNIYSQTGYWAPEAEELPLLHTWSLGVEEQFYLTYVILLLIFIKFFYKNLLAIIIALTITSFTICTYSSYLFPEANFYLLHTRAWEMLAGAVVALVPLNTNKYTYTKIYLSIALILISYLIIDSKFLFPSWITLIPIIGTCLFIHSSKNSKSLICKILSLPIIVFIGKISYSLYLWHWPIIVFYRNYIFPKWLNIPDKIILLLATFIAAFISYFLIENPLRKSKSKYNIPIILLSMLITVSLGLSVFFEKILPYNKEAYLTQASTGKKYATERTDDHYIIENNSGNFNICLIGDSHATMYAPLISEICQELKINIVYKCIPGTIFLFEDNDPNIQLSSGKYINISHKDFVQKNNFSKDINLIIFIERFDLYVERLGPKKLKESLTNLTKFSNKLITLQQVPYAGTEDNLIQILNMNARRGIMREYVESDSQKEKRLIPDQLIYEHSVKNSEKHLHITSNDLFLDKNNRTIFHDKHFKMYYRDDDHLNDIGAHLLKNRLKQILLESMNK